MEEHLGFAYWGAEFGAGLLSTFAMLGLALSAVGLYGVLAFMVNRSIPEIGIRMALGASPNSVLRLFIRRGLTISVAGVFAGILAALGTTRALASYLYWVSPSNPAIFARRRRASIGSRLCCVLSALQEGSKDRTAPRIAARVR